jgi:NAD(P)-dependent dehydrogenase (short-subunit alcohol dehydrogenase family)
MCSLTIPAQSGRGIGRDAAFSLAEAGAQVVVFADMNEETAKQSSEESKAYASNKGYETSTFKMNVQDNGSIVDMVNYVVETYGRLDYCVNAAGVSNKLYAILNTLADTNYAHRSILECMPRWQIRTLTILTAL